MCVMQGLSELAVEQERDRSEEMLKELAEKEAEKTERRMEEQHTRYSYMYMHVQPMSFHNLHLYNIIYMYIDPTFQ